MEETTREPTRARCANCGHTYRSHPSPAVALGCGYEISTKPRNVVIAVPCLCYGYSPEQFDETLPEPGTRPSFDYPYSLDPMYVTDSSGNMTLLTDETGAKNYLQGPETKKSGPRRVWKVRVIPLAEMEVEVRTELKEKK